MPLSAYVKAAAFIVLFLVALFGLAGTYAFVGFWLYAAIFIAVIVASFVFLDADLLRERARPGGQPPPLSLRIFTIVMVVHWIVAGLDRGRYLWSPIMPGWLQALGLVAMAAGFGLAFWAMRVNRFFSSVVRIQSDRGQYVVTTGPYAAIRHPGYLAGIVIIVASGIALGSWLAAAILIAFSLPFLLYRVINEDRMLQAELPGYRDYAARVRWRIVPGIW
jgi:protein-S-isoprenylcysteine O-methyltransferase Ste14